MEGGTGTVLASQRGVEPPAYCLGGSRSILLSYWDTTYILYHIGQWIASGERNFNILSKYIIACITCGYVLKRPAAIIKCFLNPIRELLTIQKECAIISLVEG